jgi:hypothetical protein
MSRRGGTCRINTVEFVSANHSFLATQVCNVVLRGVSTEVVSAAVVSPVAPQMVLTHSRNHSGGRPGRQSLALERRPMNDPTVFCARSSNWIEHRPSKPIAAGLTVGASS